MEAAFDPIRMETRYELLRTTLHELSDLLTCAGDEERVLEVFRYARGTAAEMFAAEDGYLAQLDQEKAEENREGRKLFLGALNEVEQEAQSDRLGVHAAGLVRRELLPWLHEHRSRIDRQLSQLSLDVPGDPFRNRPI